ncbi:MAG TPA: hypothetical protein VGE07_26825, partial [Herpetosiphonaceae bacterium]
MRQNLRTRLLTLLLVGILTITVVNTLGTAAGLLRVRDQAISSSSQALERQSTAALLELAQSRSDLSDQILQSGRQFAETLSDLVTNPPPITEQKAVT